MKHIHDGAILLYTKRSLTKEADAIRNFRASVSNDWAGEFSRAAAEYKKDAGEKRKYKSLLDLKEISKLLNFCGTKLLECDFSVDTPESHERICRYRMVLRTISNSRRGGEISRLYA